MSEIKMEVITISQKHPVTLPKIRKNFLLVPFFNFFFYLGFVPFKTAYSAGQDRYYLETYLIHQILCFASHLVIILTFTFLRIVQAQHLVKSWNWSKIDAAIATLNFISEVTSYIFMVYMVYFLWWMRDKYLNVIERTRLILDKNLWKTRILLLAVLLSSLVSYAVINWLYLKEFAQVTLLERDDNRSEEIIYDTDTSSEIVDIALIYNETLSDQYYWQMDELFLNKPFLVWLTYANGFFVFCQVILFALVLTLSQIANEMKRGMEDNANAVSVRKSLLLYQNLKGASDLMQHTFGDAILAYYISSICYYAQAPHVLLGNETKSERALMCYFIICGALWIFAAQLHHKVRNTVTMWVNRESEKPDLALVDRLKLMRVANEVWSWNPNAVALGNRCFSLTYQHIASMLGLIITYSIIVFQIN